MITPRDIIQELQLKRKLNRLNREIALNDVNEFKRHLNAAGRAARQNAKTVKAINKQLVKALKTV